MNQSAVEADVRERDVGAVGDFLSLDSRRQPFDDAVDDFAVLFGLVVAGRVAPDAITRGLEGNVSAKRAINEMLASGRVDSDDWSLFYQLWYRWKIPWGAASLAWWYLFCTALKQAATPAQACDLLATWLERIEGTPIKTRVSVYSFLTGIAADRGVVAVRDDISSLACFIAAAMSGVPLVKLWSEDELGALADARIDVIFSDVRPPARSPLPAILQRHLPKSRPGAADLRALCLGRHPRLNGIYEDMRRTWLGVTPEDRTFTLVHLEQRLASLEQFRLSYGNVVYDNDGIAGILGACRATDPAAWTGVQLSTATVCWFWQEAGFTLQELSQAEITMPVLRVFLERRVAEYEKIVGTTVPADLPLLDLARRLGALRALVERTHQRCLYFDGSNWERREFIVPKADILAQHVLPARLRSAMAERFGVAMPENEKPDVAWKLYLGQLLERSYTPSDLLIAMAEWAANTDDMWTDYAIFTVPLGVKLDRPWDFAVDEVFCYTALRQGFEPKQAGVPLKAVGIFNAIGQRMRYNAVKKAQNYALVKHMTPQSFLLPDIAVAEDAHQNGHYASGVRHSLRVPMAVNCRGSMWKGIADVRLSRAPYHETNRFRERDLVVACRYGAWSKAIAEETYARDLLFDRKFCGNLDDGRNIAAKVGEESARRLAG